VAQRVRKLDYLTTHTTLSPIRMGSRPVFVNYKKAALDSQPQMLKLTNCLPMVGGSLRYSSFLHNWNRLRWFSWNIAENGAKHQQ